MYLAKGAEPPEWKSCSSWRSSGSAALWTGISRGSYPVSALSAETDAPGFTFDRPRLPAGVRALNAVGGGLRRAGWPWPRLDEASLLAAAERRTRLADWGDEAFRPRLSALARDADERAGLHFVGRMAIRHKLTQLLSNRLLIHASLKANSGISDVKLDRPLFVLGHARTGTTLLYNLLAQDPACRAPALWELMDPAPPHDPAAGDAEPRIRKIEKELAGLSQIAPSLRIAHTVDARGPEECYLLLEHAFFSPTFMLVMDLPTYRPLLLGADRAEAVAAYREYRRQIQLLQVHHPGKRWISKSPCHLLSLDAFLELLPEARIVQTHRDPLEALPSLCSLVGILQSAFARKTDSRRVGAQCLEWYLECERRSRDARKGADPSRFFDVEYRDLVADPIGTVRRIYDRFEHDWTPNLEQRMRSWLAKNPQHKHGVHRYGLEQFGLDPGLLRRP